MHANRFVFPVLLLGVLGIISFSSFLKELQPGGWGGSFLPLAPSNGNYARGVSSECSIHDSYPVNILQWCGLIEKYARENAIDPNIIAAVMLRESGGRPDAYSKSGAVGLLQVMPRDGKAVSFVCKYGPCFSDRPSMSELFDPEYNVSYGVRLLANLIQKHGNLREALRAYGPEGVGYSYADLVMRTIDEHR